MLFQLDDYVDQGLLTVARHPTLPYRIYNYTQKVQFEKLWDKYTTAARGLIVNDDFELVGRPIPKFWNFHEHVELGLKIPFGPFAVYEKYDGSFISVVKHGDNILVASRGSFTSPQALAARRLLDERYGYDWLKEHHTYCFELIHPENRIVVHYGDEEKLVLLGAVRTGFTLEMRPIEIVPELIPSPFEPARILGIYKERFNAAWWKDQIKDNQEGFVVRWSGGVRVKIKGDEYVKLHRILTGFNDSRVWGALANGDNIEQLCETAHEEFQEWLRGRIRHFRTEHGRIKTEARNHYAQIMEAIPPETENHRAVFADHVRRTSDRFKYGYALFALYDNKNLDQVVWSILKPKNRGNRFWNPFEEN